MTVLESLVIALRVDDGNLKAELARIIEQARKAGPEGEKAFKPFETGLKRIAAEVRAGLRPLSDYRDELKKQEAELRRVASAQDKNSGEYRQTIEELAAVKSELVSVNTQLASHETLFDKIGNRLTTFGGVLSIGVTAPLTILGSTGVKSAQQLEVFQRSLETLIGDADQAKRVFEDLYEFDTKTTFAWPSLTKAVTLLSAFNVEADDLVPTLGRLGDVSAAVNMDVAELAELYGKAKVQGRLFMEDINQLTGRGIPIIQELAKQFGVTEDQVRGLVSEGRVGFANIEQAFVDMTSEGGRFFNMMSAQTETSQGRVMALRKEFEQVTDLIGEALLPTLDGLVDRARKAVQWFVDLDEGTQKLIINTGLFAAALGPLLIGLGQAVRVVGQLRTALIALRAVGLLTMGPAGWIALGLGAVAALALAFSGRQDSLDRRVEDARNALASGDAKSLTGALQAVADKLRPEDPLRSRLTELQEQLKKTGEVAEEAMKKATALLNEVQRAQHDAQIAVLTAERDALVLARDRLQANAAPPPAHVPGLQARLKDLDAEWILLMARLGGGEQSDELAESMKAVNQEREQVKALLQAALAAAGGAEVTAQSIDALTSQIEALDARLEALGVIASTVTDNDGDGEPPPGKNPPPVVPPPEDVKKDADEIVGILNNLNADIAELQRQRMEAQSAEEILAFDQKIAQKRAEYEYWDNLRVRDLAAAPTAVVTPPVGIPGSGAFAGALPTQDLAAPVVHAAVADFELSIRDLERLSRSAWEAFYTANSEEDRRRWFEMYQRYEELKEVALRPFTPQPLPASEPFAVLPASRALTEPGVTAGALPWRDLGTPGVFAALDEESTAFVNKVRGELASAMDLAAAKAEALGEAYDLPKEQMSLLRSAVMELIENGLSPASPALQEFVQDFLKLGAAVEEAAAQEARLKAFGEAVLTARETLGELPGPLEQNIGALREYRDSLDLTQEGAQALAVELDRLIAALERLKGIEDSGLRKFAGDVNALAASMPGLGGTFARSTGLVAEGLHKIAETDDKLEGTAMIIRGVTTAIEGIAAAASDGGLNGNQVMELIGGIAGVAAEAIGALTGIPGLGQVASAAFQLITWAVGDLSDGLAEIQEQVDQTAKTMPLLARETLDSFAREYTRQVSAGGSFGRTKAELDEEAYNAAVDLAGSFANVFATALASADFAGSLDLGFDKMIRDQLIEAFILSPEVQAQIKALVEFWQEAWEDGNLTDAERERWEALKRGLIASGEATREQLRELGLLEEEQAKKARTGGARITDLTGPARDHFADLLAPLRHLGAQLTTMQDIRNILDTRLPRGGWGGPTLADTGAPVVQIDTVRVEGVKDARSLFDELSLIARRVERGR